MHAQIARPPFGPLNSTVRLLASMRCPSDHSDLTVRDTEGHIGFLCPSCNGAWLPSKYVKSIEYSRDFSFSDFIATMSQISSRSGNLQCPSGCGCLSQVNHPDASLNWCPQCQGFWFDRGEIARLLSKHKLRERGAAEVLSEQAAWSILGALVGSFFS